MDARREAADRLAAVGRRFDVRVLEPSPPAVSVGPWFADDPVAGGSVVPLDRSDARSWASVVSSVADADGEPSLASFCADRWLGPWRRLEPLPDGFARGRALLQALAERVVAPARFAACGKIGLRWVRGGFGTPFFGDDVQVRVADGALWVSDRSLPLGPGSGVTLADACAFAGVDGVGWHGVYEPGPGWRLPETTAVDVPGAVLGALADWFGFTTSVLEQLRADVGVVTSTRVQLWPEHFDVAISVGDVSVGGSPGDDAHPEPYLYLSTGSPGNEPWGWSLGYDALLAADDQRAAALSFLGTVDRPTRRS